MEIPVESDYQYSEQYFVRVARVDASLRMQEAGVAAAVVNTPLFGDARAEGVGEGEEEQVERAGEADQFTIYGWRITSLYFTHGFNSIHHAGAGHCGPGFPTARH